MVTPLDFKLSGIGILSLLILVECSPQGNDVITERLCTSVPSLANGIAHQVVTNHIISFECNPRFSLYGPPTKICHDGSWMPPEQPVCRPKHSSVSCILEPMVPHGHVQYEISSEPYPKPEGSQATVVCDEGYSSYTTFESRFKIVCGQHGLWTTLEGKIDIRCTLKPCPSPPEIPQAEYKYVVMGETIQAEMQVEYTCGGNFILLDPANAKLTCHRGQWEGPTPTCVLSSPCDVPQRVLHGQWQVKSRPQPMPDSGHQEMIYEVGVELEYWCDHGYKLYGPRVLQCVAGQRWSSQPPECIPDSEPVWFCPKLPYLSNGKCDCADVEDSGNPGPCNLFRHDAQVKCKCLPGFQLHGNALLTCIHSSTPGLNEGVWEKMPTCVRQPDYMLEMPSYDNTHGKLYNSGDITDGKNEVSSLVIAVTTACSVLGVLLIIMAVLVFRRRRPHLVRGVMGAAGGSHLFQQGPTSPPYARVHSASIDEHDRLALMAYAEASRVHLPSYEEAMRLGNSGGGAGGCSTYSLPPNDYHNSRSRHHHHSHNPCQQRHVPVSRIVGSTNPNIHMDLNDGNNNINNNNNNNSNRHSTATTTSAGGVVGTNSTTHQFRDGVSVSEMFGSIDTVNVSMSDASTAITVDAYDSGTSCCGRSLGSTSQQANAGSLTSSHDQLANEDAPLLDASSQRETDVMSISSNPSRTSKDEQ